MEAKELNAAQEAAMEDVETKAAARPDPEELVAVRAKVAIVVGGVVHRPAARGEPAVCRIPRREAESFGPACVEIVGEPFPAPAAPAAAKQAATPKDKQARTPKGRKEATRWPISPTP